MLWFLLLVKITFCPTEKFIVATIMIINNIFFFLIRHVFVVLFYLIQKIFTTWPLFSYLDCTVLMFRVALTNINLFELMCERSISKETQCCVKVDMVYIL